MPGTGLPPIRITVGGIDYTYEAENITFSNADPGGHEMASFDVQANKASRINPGDKVLIMDGLGIIWQGRVAEPAKTIKHGWRGRRVGAATTRVSCEGAGAVLKDNAYSMVYVDRDLSRWTEMGAQRQINLIAGNIAVLGLTGAKPSPTTGRPTIDTGMDGPWNGQTRVEAWYDAGPNNLITSVYYNFTTNTNINPADTSWTWVVQSASDDVATVGTFSANLRAASGAGYFVFPTAFRFALLIEQYAITAGVNGFHYGVYWAPAVYGNHGLTGRGSDPVGFYTSDIALHAAQQAILAGGQMKIGRFDTMSQYVVPHYVQYTAVPHDTVLGDMAKLAPAHYGVWESSSTFDETPEAVFVAYGTDATVFTALADCNEADVSERLANMYTSATINYSDAAGSTFTVTVSLPNAILDRLGIKRTTTLDLGLSSTGAAQVFASFVLQALFAQARTAGSIDLPKRVRNRNGAPIASYRLKAGLDRIRVSDLPTRAGLLTSSDSDSFRISRVECNVDTSSGEITTRVEIDAGVNLIETFQARLTQQTLVAAGGA